MVNKLGGLNSILQTWLIDDGYTFDRQPEEIDFAGYKAHYVDGSVLYIINAGWENQQTEKLLNLILKAIMEAFPAVETLHETSLQTEIYTNPILKDAGNENRFIDCKMETGTGKTYVYTRLMLFKSDYDQTLFGSCSCPSEAIRKTRL